MDNIHVKSCTKIFSAIKTSLMTPPAIYISTNSRHSHHESVQWCTRIWAAWGRKSRTSPRRDSARLREMFSYKDKDTSQVVKQTHKETLEHTHIHTHSFAVCVPLSLTPESPSWQATILPLPSRSVGTWALSMINLNLIDLQNWTICSYNSTYTPPSCCVVI